MIALHFNLIDVPELHFNFAASIPISISIIFSHVANFDCSHYKAMSQVKEYNKQKTVK